MVLITLPTAPQAAKETTKVSLRADASSGVQPHAPSTPQPAPAEFSVEVDHLLQHAAVSDTSRDLESEVLDGDVEEHLAPQVAATGSSVFLWSVVSATGLVIALLGGFVWWKSGAGESAATLAASEPAVAPVTETAQAPTPFTSHTAPPPADLNSATQGQPQQVQKPLIEAAPDPLPELPPAIEAPPESSEKESPSQDSSSPPSKPANDKPEETEPEQASEERSIPQLIDPLGINPADLDLLLVPKSSTPAPSQVPLAQPKEEHPATANAAPDPLEGPPHPRRFEPGSATLGPSFTEQFAPGAFEMRLAMRIPSIRWSNAPLNRVLSELGQLSGIPVQIDPSTLRMAPTRSTHRITLSQQDVSFDAILNQLASSLRLEVGRVDDLLLLQKPDVRLERQVSYPVADLAKGTAAIAELVQLIDALALDEKTDAVTSNDGTQIVVNRPTEQQYEVLLFLERLRKSRGLPTRSKYPAELVSAEPVLQALKKRLSQPTTFAVVDWTPLSDVFDYWQDSSGLELLVDWQELSTIDLRPLSTIAASADRVPWGNALDDCLAPLDLGWIPIDSETLQITTASAAESHRWIEFYVLDRFAKLPARARTADGLRDALAARCDPESLAQTIIAGDPSGKQVIVRANRNVHGAILALFDER